ncbi:MAG: zinc transporter ZntB [Gammaproteobacteria bacterium]|nr:MAG: zinc transporter ZntB [Gammaproteobacteria bacterium]
MAVLRRRTRAEVADPAAPADGLICAYRLLPGGGQRLEWPEIRRWQAGDGLLWVHLNFTERGARRWLQKDSAVPEPIVDALLVDDGRPRSERHQDGWLVMLRGVNMNPGAQAEDMVAIRLWLEPDRVVSTCRRRLQSVAELRAAIEAGHGPATPGELLIALLQGLTQRLAEAVDRLEDEIDAAEAAMLEDSSVELQTQLSSLRRRCARMRRHLAPQREALERIVRIGGGCLQQEEIWQIRELGDRVTRALEDLELAAERAMVAHEEFVARVAQEQNARIYLLSIVAALFLPLSFLTGLFGMNVAGLPGLEYPRAFWVVSGLMLALAAGLLAYFRFKRWI